MDIQEYEYSLDDSNKNPYGTNYFKNYSSKYKGIVVQSSDYGKSIGNTSNGSWIKYNRFDFENKVLKNIKLTVAHPSGYPGILRIYLLKCDENREIIATNGIFSNLAEGEFQLAEHYFTKGNL